jgi:hypothetical protein
MPRDPGPARTSLVASATRYDSDNPPDTGVQRQQQVPGDWQRECYHHRSICGEARFASAFMGHAFSRATLSVGKVNTKGEVKATTTGPAHQFLRGLLTAVGGEEALLDAAGEHFTVAGEFWLIGREGQGPEGTDTWDICSVLQVDAKGAQWTVDFGDKRGKVRLNIDGKVPDQKKDYAIRVWIPDPANPAEADSPFKSLLPVLREIEGMTRHIAAQVQSRLALAGLLAIPSEATQPPPPPVGGRARKTTSDLDNFMRLLADAMAANLNDQAGTVRARVPIMMKMPGANIGQMKLLEFWSKLDEQAHKIRDDAIKRFFLGMDAPPEVLSGIGGAAGTGGGRSNGVSHWGAWQIEEQTIKMHVEPGLKSLASALRSAYIQPLTKDYSDVVLFSTEDLRLRPDRSEPSIVLSNMGLLKPEVTVKENGFDPDTDMMSDEEWRKWMLRKIASGSATPEQVAAANALLGIQLPVPQGQGQTVREARPDPTLDNLPNRDRTPEAASLLPVAEALVLQALGRAGNRIRSKFDVRVNGVPAYESHTLHACNGSAAELLTDAFPTAPLVLGEDADRVVPVLHAYCRSLMANQQPHTRDALARFLKVAKCSA